MTKVYDDTRVSKHQTMWTHSSERVVGHNVAPRLAEQHRCED